MKTNREYFSWSQYSLWKSSKKEFYKRYVLGEKSKPNVYFDKGSELGNYLETGDIPFTSQDGMLEQVGNLIPKLDIMEDKLEVQYEHLNLLAFVDSGALDGTEFLEYKTGKIPWTQDKVDTHEQLDFYALCYYLRSGQEVIPTCRLYWIETEETDDGLRYTGYVEKFERSFTEEDMIHMLGNILKALKEIEEFEYVEMEIEDELVDRYIELTGLVNKYNDEISVIKMEIQVRMEADSVLYAASANGRFSMSKRTSWNYTSELKEFDSLHKSELKKKQVAEQKSGDATQSYTESLRFSIIK